MHKSGECAGEDREPCLLRQLTAANEMIAELKRPFVLMSCTEHGPWDQMRESGCPMCVFEMRRDLSAADERAAAFERAKKAWLLMRDPLNDDVMVPVMLLDAYFATGEKEG
jgi:hypothetical protein